MQQANRSKLCKLQNKPGEDIYILYKAITVPTNKTNLADSMRDCAGIFDTKQDAEQVATCLNNIFSKLNDKNWKWYQYRVNKIFLNEHSRDTYAYGSDYDYGSSNEEMSSSDPESESEFTRRSFKYEVTAMFYTKPNHELKTVKSEWVIDISKSFKTLERERQEKEAYYIKNYQKHNEMRGVKHEWKIIKYRTNDILPTMYFDDYHIKNHKKNFKRVINELKDFPQAQANRQQMRRAAREKLFQYSDSSDSEDDTKYKRVTKRSLLHTPTRPKK
jgi:hypothetical protein